jgi:predicted phage terminase large subunit-like protein
VQTDTELDPTQVSAASSLLRSIQASHLKRSLLAFTREAWLILEPEHPFVQNWHIEELCTLLEQVAAGFGHAGMPAQFTTHEPIDRVVINIPPGTMKSLLVSVIFPCWLWARNPKLRILTAAYSDKRALDANLKARLLLKSQWFQQLFPLEFVEDQDTKGRFDTTKGGWRIATSVGGEGTGLHPDLIVIDDAATAADAQSEAERKKVNGWFDQTVSSRGVSRGVKVIVIGQRLHEEDLPGHLLKRAGWTHVCWPMRFMTARPATDTQPGYQPDPRDHRTKEGDLLFPQLFTEAKVRQLELDLGPYGTSGQLQQQPSPEGGGLFKREWFKFVDAAPALARRCRGWDTAASEGKGDYLVGVKISEEFEWDVKDGKRKFQSTGRFFVEDVQRDQLGPDGVDKLMKVTAQLDGKACSVREEKEGGSSGVIVINARTKLLRGFNYAGVQLGGSKVTRAKPFRSQCEGGNVYLVKAHWNEAYIVELCAFPTAKHDDQVDASSCAFNSVLLEEPPRSSKAQTW